jgi:hypothetical protein
MAYEVSSNLNNRLAASLKAAISAASPLKSRGFGNPTAYAKVTNRGGRVDIDVFVEAAEYLLYVSEGTGANSNDPAQSSNPNKRGISPRNIFSAWTDGTEFESIIGDIAQEWLDDYFTQNDIDDIPANKFPQFENVFINGIDL